MKNKLRIILASLVVFAMCFGQVAVFADGEDMHSPQKAISRMGEKYTYSKVMYFNSSDEEIEFPEAGEITAKIMVKSNTETASLFFAVLCYEGGKLKAAGVSSERPAVTPDGVEYTAKVQVTSDEDVKLVGVLWENAKNMNPVSVSSISTSSDARLSYLAVDNGTLEFDINTTEYEVVLEDPTRVKAPYISVATVDNGAKVEICDPKKFPGEAKITVTSADGTNTKEYTIKYVSNGQLATVNSSSPQYVLLKNNLSTDSSLIGNRPHIPTTHVDESLIGLDYITTTNESKVTSYTVSLKRPGNVMAFLPGYCKGVYDNGTPYDWVYDNFGKNGWVIDGSGWDKGPENTYADEDGTYGDRVTFDGEGNVIATDGIVNNIPELSFITGSDEEKSKWEKYYESSYDTPNSRKQGWFYIDWRSQGWANQGYVNHSWGAYAFKCTKSVNAGETVSIAWSGAPSHNYTVVVLQYAPWVANDYTDFNLND